MLPRGFELLRRCPPALSSVFICVISFSDSSRPGIDGRLVVSVTALSLGSAGLSDVGEKCGASGDECECEVEFLRMPLGFLGTADGECGAGDSCAIVVAAVDIVDGVGGSMNFVHVKVTAIHKRCRNAAGPLEQPAKIRSLYP